MCQLIRYIRRNVDGLQSLSSTLVGTFSLVDVSAKFGTLGGMLIGYSC